MLPRNDGLGSGATDGETGHDGRAVLGLCRSKPGIQARHETVLHLIGVTEDIALVKLQRASEVIDASDITIKHAWLNHVLPFSTHELLVENALQCRRAKLHIRFESSAVDGVTGGNAGASDRLSLCVISVVEGQLRPQGPSAK